MLGAVSRVSEHNRTERSLYTCMSPRIQTPIPVRAGANDVQHLAAIGIEA